MKSKYRFQRLCSRMSAAKKSQALITIHAFSRISDNFIHLFSRRRASPTPPVSVYPRPSHQRWDLPGWLAFFERALSLPPSTLSNSGARNLPKANLVVLHQACNRRHKLLADCATLSIDPVRCAGHLSPVGHVSLLVHELLQDFLLQGLLFALLERVRVVTALLCLCVATVAEAGLRRVGHRCGYLMGAQLELTPVIESRRAHRLRHVVA